MPPLNWDTFSQLPGSAEFNFEMLCRALVRRQYSKFGIFAALANQPGVEFHLKLTTDCSLGKPGEWLGWQCRWYDLPSGRALGGARRKKIKDAISLSEKTLPGLTSWVLWTRRTLTKADQEWFFGLKTKLKLDLWTAAEVEANLSGEAAILRGSYFGELVLTPQALASLHQESTAPLRKGWNPELHQVVNAEREVQQTLGEPSCWTVLTTVGEQITLTAERVPKDPGKSEGTLSKSVTDTVEFGRSVRSLLDGAFAALKAGDFDLLKQISTSDVDPRLREASLLPRLLRKNQHPAALSITNILAEIRKAFRLLAQLKRLLDTRSLFVLADAGSGKTYLAIHLTIPTPSRPAGVLLRGSDLQAGGSINDLAKRVVIQGVPVASFETLMAALDAAGQRARTRLPIVIDGLNEAEDPRDWKNHLLVAEEILRKYPFVLLVCTLRPAFREDSVPSGSTELSIPDFGNDTTEAIWRYFKYYRINTIDFEFPVELLSNPLTLLLFCEVSNPGREEVVKVENIPRSLIALFGRYLDQVSERIVQLAKRPQRFFEHDIKSALYQIGLALWQEKTRSLDFDALRKRLQDVGRPWDQSIVRALENEGVLLRESIRSEPRYRVRVAYDALGGYLIASALLADLGGMAFEDWAKDPATLVSFAHTGPERHPLGDDIFAGLVGLLPRRLPEKQLWMFFDSELRDRALYRCAYLDGAYLDLATVNEIRKLVTQYPDGNKLFRRLKQTRGVQGHPLNATFLDSILAPMGVKQRDLCWTEWTRIHNQGLIDDLTGLERRWRSNSVPRSEAERLRARWVMWLLTSTVVVLRNRATRALYWFGRSERHTMFQLAIRTLSLNDPYVSERSLAAAYGVCMAEHCRPKRHKFRTLLLPQFGHRLYEKMFTAGAPNSTTHELSRDYARRIIELALIHNPQMLGKTERARVTPPFLDGGIREWHVLADPNNGKYDSGNGPLDMDFANQKIGWLVPNRSRYDFQHPEYKKVLGSIVWRFYQLGYSLEAFGEIDTQIANSLYQDRDKFPLTERYGEKYARIAYFELYGYRKDLGLLERPWTNNDERPSDSDLDPSFPEDPLPARVIENLLGDASNDVADWVHNGPSPDFGRYLIYPALGEESGPWILLDGFRGQRDTTTDRHGFVKLQCLVLLKEDEKELLSLVKKKSPSGRWIPEGDQDHLAFAGEIAWCNTIPRTVLDTLDFVVGEKQIAISDQEPQAVIWAPKSDEPGAKPGFKKENIFKKIPAYVPVRRNSFPQAPGVERPNGVVPSKEFVQNFQLWMDLPTWNLRDQDGQLSCVLFDTGGHGDSEHHLFLRKDLLDRLLSSQKLSLVWIASGERQHYSASRSKMETSPGYKFFHQVFRYSKGKAIRSF